MIKIKICGMKYPNNIIEVSDLLPDFMGFIFWKKSARYFDESMPKIPKSIKKVGVFVDADFDEIILISNKYKLDFVQLHGNETISFCQKLKNNNINIIKVFAVDDDFDFQKTIEFEPVCDYFLFDTKGKLPGGNGTIFNWDVLKKNKSTKPFFLSGGIGINEISVIKTLNLPIFAIDANSKLETIPGEKNVDACKIFISKLNSRL